MEGELQIQEHMKKLQSSRSNGEVPTLSKLTLEECLDPTSS
jgi:hypothetical protein